MLSWLVTQLWGAEVVAVHGSMLQPAELPGFIAERSGRVTGLLTYQLVGDVLEIVTLNAIDRHEGIGTRLIEAAAVAARRYGCRHVGLTTTNDNIDALRSTSAAGSAWPSCGPGRSTGHGRSSPRSRRSASTASPSTTR